MRLCCIYKSSKVPKVFIWKIHESLRCWCFQTPGFLVVLGLEIRSSSSKGLVNLKKRPKSQTWNSQKSRVGSLQQISGNNDFVQNWVIRSPIKEHEISIDFIKLYIVIDFGSPDGGESETAVCPYRSKENREHINTCNCYECYRRS